jgi:hypothetical protein
MWHNGAGAACPDCGAEVYYEPGATVATCRLCSATVTLDLGAARTAPRSTVRPLSLTNAQEASAVVSIPNPFNGIIRNFALKAFYGLFGALIAALVAGFNFAATVPPPGDMPGWAAQLYGPLLIGLCTGVVALLKRLLEFVGRVAGQARDA